MKRKDAARPKTHWMKRKATISIVATLAVVGAIGWGAKTFWGPETATAQPPANGPATSRPSSSAAKSSVSHQQQKPKAPPGVVANVNGQQVSQQRLAQECLRRYGNEVLESLVNRTLILEACKKHNIQVTQQDIEDEIKRNADRFGMSIERWEEMLAEKRDVSPQQYRSEILWPTLALRRLAANRIVVSKAELDQAFQSEYGPQVRCRLITTNKQQLALQLHKAANDPQYDFADLARRYSDDTASASAGGIVPPIRMHVGDERIWKAAFQLKPGEVSQIVNLADQYLIIKCEAHVPARNIAPQHASTIRSRLEDSIRDNKLRNTASEIFQKLQSTAEVVNVLNSPQLQQKYPNVAALINNRQLGMKYLVDECVKRHGKEVLEIEVSRLLLKQELGRRQRTVTDAAIDEEIARAADAYGYLDKEGRPDINAWLKAVTEADNVSVELYVEDAVWRSVALKELVKDRVQVSEKDLKEGFESNYGERVEVLAVVLNNHRLAQKVWEMARNNPTDEFFGQLANENSIEPVSQANFGRVPPVRRHSGQPLVEQHAFNLKPGQMSDIIAVKDKFIVLRCLGRTDPVVDSLDDEIRGELIRDIREKKLRLAMAEEFERLFSGSQVTNYLTGEVSRGTQIARPPAQAPATLRR